MTAGVIALLSVAGWLLSGYVGGLYWARISYLASREDFGFSDEKFHRGNALFAMVMSIMCGPLTIVAIPVWALMHRSVDTIPEVKARQDKERIARLEADLDAAHRELGIAPLRRDAS